MANVLGGSSVFSGPTAAEYSQQNLQALAQAAQNANQFAQMRSQDLQNRRAAFLEMAKANGMSPALMLATPEGEAAAKAILGKDFFGMIGPHKKKWEAFFGMPMSQEDWNAFAGLEKAKGNLTFDMAPGQAPGASDRARAAQSPARTSVPLSAAPSAPAPASTPAQPEVSRGPGQLGQSLSTDPLKAPTLAVTPPVPASVAVAPMTSQQMLAASADPESAGYQGALGLSTADAAKVAVQEQMKKLQGEFIRGSKMPGKTPAELQYIVNNDADPVRRQAAFELLRATPKQSIVTTYYNPDGSLKPSAVSSTLPEDSPEQRFREDLIRQFPEQKDKIQKAPLEVLQKNNPGTWSRIASGNTGAGAVEAPRTVAGVTLSAAPTPKELGAVTRSVEAASRDAVRTWKANPAVQDAGYQANLQMAARMLQSHETPGARLEDNPMMAKAVLNFTEQAYRKVEADIRRADISNQLDTMQVMSALAAQSAMGVIAQSQQAVEMLKPLQAQWDSLYKPQIEALAKAGKTPAEISKIMAEDPQYMAADKLMKTTIARAFGDGTAVTQTYIKDPVGFFNALFGGMAKTTPTGYAVDLSAGAGQRTAAPPDQLDALASSIMDETK